MDDNNPEPRYPELGMAMDTVLGVAMEHPDRAAEIFARVRIADFHGSHRHIAEALHKLRLDKEPIEALSIIDEMNRRGTLSRSGGPAEVLRVAGFGFGEPMYACDIIACSCCRAMSM